MFNAQMEHVIIELDCTLKLFCKFFEKPSAPPLRFSALPEIARNKFVEAGCPIILQCEVSDPAEQVCWQKDGVKLLPERELDIRSEGPLRAVRIESAEFRHAGLYCCEAVDDRIEFKVDVAGDLSILSFVKSLMF